MGAIDAFVKTFSLMVEGKRLYILALMFSLIMAPLTAYLIPEPDFEHTVHEKTGNVIVEEYGSNLDVEAELTGYLKEIAKIATVLISVAIVLGSVFQYAITKGAFLEDSGEEYSIKSLLIEGVRHVPAIVAIGLIFTTVALGLIGMGLIPIVVGALLMPEGIVLMIIGVFVLMFLILLAVGLNLLAVPLYIEKGSITASFEAFGLVFRNIKTSIMFGLLISAGIAIISFISSPIGFIGDVLPSGGLSRLIIQIMYAPFNALIFEFTCIGGVALYREFQRIEETKKADEELMSSV